jgi:riboflavin synthase
MFTGIITDLGRVLRVRRGGSVELTIATAYDTARIAEGASIACSGVCLTVVGCEAGAFRVEASAETVACSTLGAWREGRHLNLETALRAGDELGGHIVSGHVDGTALLVERHADGDSVRFTFEVAASFAPFVASKGSVALDGVSLTVNEVDGTRFGVNMIPYTLAHTSFGDSAPGERVNFEIDPLARYVARLIEARGGRPR